MSPSASTEFTPIIRTQLLPQQGAIILSDPNAVPIAGVHMGHIAMFIILPGGMLDYVSYTNTVNKPSGKGEFETLYSQQQRQYLLPIHALRWWLNNFGTKYTGTMVYVKANSQSMEKMANKYKSDPSTYVLGFRDCQTTVDDILTAGGVDTTWFTNPVPNVEVKNLKKLGADEYLNPFMPESNYNNFDIFHVTNGRGAWIDHNVNY